MKHLTKQLVVVVTSLFVGTHLLLPAKVSAEHNEHEHITANAEGTKKPLYYCVMHPNITSDKPGTCPICKMDLVLSETTKKDEVKPEKQEQADSMANPSSAKPKERKILFYKHPMGKNVTSPTPKKDEMGMDYIPVYEDEVKPSAQKQSSIEGRTSFSISQYSKDLLGVTTAQVTAKQVRHEIQTAGRVAFDPNLYAAIDEYRVAKNSLEQSSSKDAKGYSNALLSAAAIKLELMGVSKEQIKELGSKGVADRGYILPNGNVWVYADIFESELSFVKIGQSVTVTSDAYPTNTFEGVISSINPTLNTETHTITVKAEVKDPSHILKPGMFLDVKVISDLGRQLVIPDGAVIRTGNRDIAFSVDEKDLFNPKEIKLGSKVSGGFVVLAGLNENDTVVSSATFLVDSESRLQDVIQSAMLARE